MERDGVVRRVGRRPGTTRPFHVFELTPEVEQLLSQAYLPLLTQLVQVFASALPSEQVEALMRTAGKGLASELPRAKANSRRPSVACHSRKRVVEHTSRRGDARRRQRRLRDSRRRMSASGPHRQASRGVSRHGEPGGRSRGRRAVSECCDRTGRPKCCFEIKGDASRDGSPPAQETRVAARGEIRRAARRESVAEPVRRHGENRRVVSGSVPPTECALRVSQPRRLSPRPASKRLQVLDEVHLVRFAQRQRKDGA